MQFIKFKPDVGEDAIMTPLENVVDIVEHDDGTVTIRYRVNYAICEIYSVNKNTIKYICL